MILQQIRHSKLWFAVAAHNWALAEHGLEADLVPAMPSQEGLLAELPRPAGRVLVAGAEHGRRLVADSLGADVLVLYRTIELPPDEPPVFFERSNGFLDGP